MTYFNNLGQGRVGFKSSGGGGGVDADAQAFITAAAITGATQQSAIITLVTQLKTYGIWSKMKAIYPFVGGTAAQHRFNLKDPRAVDPAFYLTFNGGGTHGPNGYQPNGNSYANTKLIPSSVLSTSSTHVSVYSRTNATGNYADMGAIQGIGTSYLQLLTKWSDNIFYGQMYDTNFSDNTVDDSLGFFVGNRQSATGVKLIKNSTVITSKTSNVISTITSPLYLGARNNNNVDAQNYSLREQAFASIGDGLTDTEATNFYTAVQTFQTTLGRQVGVPIVADTDAQAFLNAAVITDQTQVTAITTLVTDLKSANIWTKMKALYPFVGGTAAQHRFNLKDPRTVDAAYYLTFFGGGTHSATGYLPNGNSYADTKLIPNSNLSNTSAHISKYNRNNDLTGNKIDGVYDNGNTSFFQQNYSAGNGMMGSLSNIVSYTQTDTKGLFTTTRTSSTSLKVFKNSTQQGSTNTITSPSLPNIVVYIGARNELGGVPSFYNTYETAFFSLGDGLTDTEAANLYTAVQKYQTTLGRNV